MRSHRLAHDTFLVALAIGAFAGCFGSDGGGASSVDGGASVDASTPASTSARVGPAGGTLRLGAVTIDVPAGALDREITIELTEIQPSLLSASLPAGIDLDAQRAVVALSPGDLSFETPARVSMPRPDGTNVVLWLAHDATDAWQTIENVALGADAMSFATDRLGAFVAGEQARPAPQSVEAPQLCTFLGVFEPGAGEGSHVDFLCDGDGKSLHDLAARFPDLYDVGELASELGRGVVDLNIDADAEPFGVAFAWVDGVFIGRFPVEDPTWSCLGCGLPCQDWTTLVLEPGVHQLRVETYDSALCTRHYDQGNIVCGDDFDAQASMTGLYEGPFTVTVGACNSQSVTPTPIEGGTSPGGTSHVRYSIQCSADIWAGPSAARVDMSIDRDFDFDLIEGINSVSGVNIELERSENASTGATALRIKWFTSEDGVAPQIGTAGARVNGEYSLQLMVRDYDGPGTYDAPLARVSGVGESELEADFRIAESDWIERFSSNNYVATYYDVEAPNLDINDSAFIASLPSRGYDPDQIVATLVIDQDDASVVRGSFEFDGYGGLHSWDDPTRMDVHTCTAEGEFVLYPEQL